MTLPHVDGEGPQLDLLLHASGARLGALLTERERLLRQVGKKKGELERAMERARQATSDLAARVAPVVEKHDRLRAELRALFDEILGKPSLSARARKEVTRIRRMLEDDGILEPASDFGEVSSAEEGFGDAPPSAHAHAHASEPELEPTASYAEREVASANPHGQATGHESLRRLFRRLTLALHPDRAQHESDRERRTDVMKEVTRAYADGDLARLLDLEKLWENGQSSPLVGDDERRCRELEDVNQELRAQFNRLNRELRRVRRETSSGVGGMPIDALVDVATAELEELESMRDFVASFRDGKISLRQFVEGPEDLDDDLLDLELDALAESLSAELASIAASRPGPKKKRQTRKRR